MRSFYNLRLTRQLPKLKKECETGPLFIVMIVSLWCVHQFSRMYVKDNTHLILFPPEQGLSISFLCPVVLPLRPRKKSGVF